jgi:hypothetical protein
LEYNESSLGGSGASRIGNKRIEDEAVGEEKNL